MNLHLTTILILYTCNTIFGQVQPLELVKKVLTDVAFAKDSLQYSTGEYKGHPNATDIGNGTQLTFNSLYHSESMAVINVTFTDSLGKGLDTYIHLQKNDTWKICAFRALAMTGILELAKEELEKFTLKQIDSLVNIDNGLNFESREDFYLELDNIKLTLALDKDIVAHFNKNKLEFEELKSKIIKAQQSTESENNTHLMEKYSLQYKDLLLSSFSTSSFCTDCIEFIIGGIIDNSVGYLYIPKGNEVPKPNPSRLIMIKEIGNGWYLFKTT